MRYLILFVLCNFCVELSAQTVQNTHSSSISDNFDALSIQAYAVNGQSKIEELIEYLNLMNSAGIEEDLDAQISSNILQLFSVNDLVIQGISSNVTFIDVRKWIADFKRSSSNKLTIHFKSSQLHDSYWKYTFDLSYEWNGKIVRKKMDVELLMSRLQKSFGNHQKQVWQQSIQKITFR